MIEGVLNWAFQPFAMDSTYIHILTSLIPFEVGRDDGVLIITVLSYHLGFFTFIKLYGFCFAYYQFRLVSEVVLKWIVVRLSTTLINSLVYLKYTIVDRRVTLLELIFAQFLFRNGVTIGPVCKPSSWRARLLTICSVVLVQRGSNWQCGYRL